MDNKNTQDNSFIARVLRNESTKKGAAGLAAGVLIAVITEAIWGSNS